MMPYILTPQDIRELDAARANRDEKAMIVWFDEHSGVKRRIKGFCITDHQWRCCYCKVQQPDDNRLLWDLEHIISKANYEPYRFDPRNLAISCKKCNRTKGDKEVLVDRLIGTRGTLPFQSADYKIPHPYLDNYDDHVKVYLWLVYGGLDEKGTNLIQMVGLNDAAEGMAGLIDHLLGSVTGEFAVRLAAATKANDGSAEQLILKKTQEMRQIQDIRPQLAVV
jgi:hypothetical protein